MHQSLGDLMLELGMCSFIVFFVCFVFFAYVLVFCVFCECLRAREQLPQQTPGRDRLLAEAYPLITCVYSCVYVYVCECVCVCVCV